MSEYTKRVVRGTLLVFMSTFLVAVFNYLLRLLLARKFTIEEYGAVYAIVSLFGLFSLFVALGLYSALTKYISEFRVKGKLREIKDSIVFASSVSFSVAVVIGVLSIIFSKVLAVKYLGLEHTYPLFILFAFHFILVSLINITKGVLKGFQRMWYYSLLEFLQPFLIFTITLALVLYGFGIISVFIAYAIFSVVGLGFSYYLITRKVFPEFSNFKFRIHLASGKRLFKFGIFMVLVGTFGLFLGKVDTIFLTLFRSLEEVGLYNAAFPTVGALWGMGGALVIVLMPIFSEMWSRKDVKKMEQGLDKLYTYVLIVIFPVTLLVFLFPDIILNILFGERFISAVSTLRILSFLVVVRVITQINSAFLAGIGKPKEIAKYTIWAGVMNVILNLLLVPLYGLVGAATATLISFLFILVYSLAKVNENVKLRFNWQNYFKIFVSGLLLAGVIYFLKGALDAHIILELMVVIPIAVLLYALTIFKLKILTITEIKTIINLTFQKTKKG